MKFNLEEPQQVRASIKVIGVGGGGCNAVNRMMGLNLAGIDFIAANTDMQALVISKAPTLLQLGSEATRGLGTGGNPDIGRDAALEDEEAIRNYLIGTDMVFITAGMGGGTGTGAAPIIAQIAKELGALTIAVVTKPFKFEGKRRMDNAETGIRNLQEFVDTLLIIPNQKLLNTVEKNTSFMDAFGLADEILANAVQGISDLITVPGLINLDFADVRTIMSGMGKALMGTAIAEGPNRAEEAVRKAISSPLLDDISIDGARGVLINVTGGSNMTLFEVNAAAELVEEAADREAQIMFGAVFDERYTEAIKITVIATGFEPAASRSKSLTVNWPSQVREPAPPVQEFSASASYPPSFSTIPASRAVSVMQAVEMPVQQENVPEMIRQTTPVAEAFPNTLIYESLRDRPIPSSTPESPKVEVGEQPVIYTQPKKLHLFSEAIHPELELEKEEQDEFIEKLPPYNRRNLSNGSRSTQSDLDSDAIQIDSSHYMIPAFLRRKAD